MQRLKTCVGGAVVGLLAATASAQPDVVVFDIYNTANWGTSGSTVAYTIGTESCNYGSGDLDWYAGTPDVPVIGQNLYRLKDGRFEQLGQSWLKWAFTSVNGNSCGSCQHPGTGSRLGPGCSDPYSAGLNGSQGGLGPKSVVNPYTGYHPGSHATPSGPSTIAGRIQVATADVQPGQNPDALYFVEGQYVTPDDAAAGNSDNNASWRQVFVQGNLDLSFSGGGQTSSTVIGEPAILAWKANDPTVGVEAFDISGDGRGFLGWSAKRTSSPASDVDGDGNVGLSDLAIVLANFGLAGGATLSDGDVNGDGNVDLSDLADVLGTFGAGPQWHYEFAVHNLTIARAIVGFEVTTNDSASVTNDYFKGVEYHSGEPYSAPNWRFQQQASGALWIGQSYAANQNAGVIRWGNLYNFAFDAPFGPDTLTDVKLIMFEPGAPETVVVPLPERASNNQCNKAIEVGNGSFVVSTVEATTDGPDEAGCAFAANDRIDNDVWYRYLAPCSAVVAVDVCDADFDSRVAVYGATCPSVPGGIIACDDDGCGSASAVSFTAVAGNEYLIRVGGRDGGIGTATLVIDCDLQSNDDCEDAQVVSEGTLNFDTTGASTDGPNESSGCGNPGSDIWFSYTPGCNGTVDVSLCGSAYDTALAAYDATGGCPTSGGNYITCNDDSCGLDSQISFSATAGTEYLIRVAGYSGASGVGTMDISLNCD